MVKVVSVYGSNISSLEIDGKITLKKIHKLLKNKNKLENCKKIYNWEFDNKEEIVMYGYKSGQLKRINKLELPSPIENTFYYDELVFCLLDESKKPINFSLIDFNEFYSSCHGGFDDINSDDSYCNFENDEEYEDDGFVELDK
jgi:hypothetical protein